MHAKRKFSWIRDFNAHTFGLCVLAITLPWPIRFSSLAVILFASLAVSRLTGFPKYSKTNRLLIICFAGYFLLHLLNWLTSAEVNREGWLEVEKKLSLIILPVLILDQALHFNAIRIRFILMCFIGSVIAACGTCVLVATSTYLFSGDQANFFYHDFCRPIQHHAVYFSLQIILATLSLFYITRNKSIKAIHYLILLLFSCCVLLLSSKLMIPCYAAVILGILYYYRSTMSRKVMLGLAVFFIGITTLTILSTNKVRNRFTDVSFDSLTLVSKKYYGPAQYFDGLTLRCIQIKFAFEILSENKSWAMGVGSGNAQRLLNEKYLSTGMFSGGDNRSGYIGLNFHNQFIETGVRFGLSGLLLLLIILFTLIKQARSAGNNFLLITLMLFCLFFTTESVLETQRGLLLFLFFPLILLRSEEQIKPEGMNG